MKSKVRHAARSIAAAFLRKFAFPGRYRLYKMVESILGENPGTFVVPLRHGGKILVDGVVDSEIFYLGEYSRSVISFLARNAKGGQTIFDIGAHIGSYTVPMARRVGPSGRVYAFEALRANYDVLLKNVALNGLTNVTTVFGAVADRTGTFEAPEVIERSGFMSNYSLASASPRRTRIPSWSLDDFVLQQGVGRIDLMKIDIEGSETMALRGGANTFSKGMVKTVVCEFNPYWLPRMGSSVEELYEIFESFGMEGFLLTRFSRLRPIDKDFCRHAMREFDAVLKPRRTH